MENASGLHSLSNESAAVLVRRRPKAVEAKFEIRATCINQVNLEAEFSMSQLP
jgi:hypothetical protein